MYMNDIVPAKDTSGLGIRITETSIIPSASLILAMVENGGDSFRLKGKSTNDSNVESVVVGGTLGARSRNGR